MLEKKLKKKISSLKRMLQKFKFQGFHHSLVTVFKNLENVSLASI